MTGLLTRPKPPKRRAVAPTRQQPFLEPRPQTWGWHVAGLIVLATLACGLFFVAGHPALGVFALIGLFFVAAFIGVIGVRGARRDALVDKLVEALGPVLGAGPDRSVVRVSKWNGFWNGIPTRIRLRYLAGLDDTDPAWLGEIRSHIARRLGAEFDILAHDKKKCVLVLQPAPEAGDQEAPSAIAIRAQNVVTELLGSPAMPTPDVDMEWDGEDLKVLDVHHSVGARMTRPIYRQQVERTLSTMLPGRWRAKWDLEADKVRFEIRPTLPEKVLHPIPLVTNTDARNGYADLEIPYGIDEDGNTMTWVPKVNPHLLITGTSGSGKTVTMQGILGELSKHGAMIDVNDAKLIEFLGFKTWPNVRVVSSNLEEQVRLIHAAWELQEERYELIVNGEASEEDFEPYFLFLDEFADFREAVTDWYADIKQRGEPTKPPVLKKVRSVARKGRTARVHFVVGLQRPDAEFLTGEVRDNFSARISMGRLSPQGALMMWENASTGVSLPRKSRGRGITLNEDSQPVEFQSFWTPDPRKVKSDDADDLAILEGLRPSETRHERVMIIPPKPREFVSPPKKKGDEEIVEILEPDYNSWASAKIVPYDAELAATLRPKFTVYEGGGQPSKSKPAASKLALVDRADADLDVDEETGDGYGETTSIRAIDLKPGDLVLLDDQIDLWGAVEAAEPDVVAPDNVCVDYRTDDNELGSESLPSDEPVPVRKPLEFDEREGKQ